jgi:type III secretion system needle length determinant
MAETEGKGSEFREAVRQDAEKSGISGKPEGKPESRFKSEAEGEELAEAGRKMGARDEKADSALSPSFSGDALLRALGGSYAPLETQAVAPSSAPGASSDAPALAADLAERILVNTDNRAAGGEVRITLKESVLPDTEILLRREGEHLVVQLVSGNPASLDALRLAREDLRDKLLALDRDISVDVLDNRNQEQGDSGHSGRRSRGLDYFSGSER